MWFSWNHKVINHFFSQSINCIFWLFPNLVPIWTNQRNYFEFGAILRNILWNMLKMTEFLTWCFARCKTISPYSLHESIKDSPPRKKRASILDEKLKKKYLSKLFLVKNATGMCDIALRFLIFENIDTVTQYIDNSLLYFVKLTISHF